MLSIAHSKVSIVTATEYKKHIKHLLYLKTYGGVIEESVNHWNADIIGVTYDKWEVNEFEIKVSVSDLRGEVRAIKRALQGGIYKQEAWVSGSYSYNRVKVDENVSLTKLEKHYCYLVDDKQGSMTFNGTAEEEARMNIWKDRTNKHECFVPHKFYFAVPGELVDEVKALLKDVPFYGIMNADNGVIVKSAKKLPRANIRVRDLFNLFMRACTEWRSMEYNFDRLKETSERGHAIYVRHRGY